MTTAIDKSSEEIFEPLVEDGGRELQRNLPDLALSGLIAGLDIGFGPLAMGVVAGRAHEAFHMSNTQALLLGSLLYPLGFIFVIMGRSELYTENTLTPVAGLLAGQGSLPKLGKRWGIVLACNLLGTVIFSIFAAHTAIVFDQYRPLYRTMGLALVSQPFLQALLAAIFGGWLVALMAWLIQAAKSNTAQILLIYVVTYLLVGLALYHSIIGSIEVLLGMFAGAPITWGRWFGAFVLPAVLGNTIGGVIFVTALKGLQARSRR